MTGLDRHGGENAGRKTLTGVWNGLYSYPALFDPVSFVASLIDGGVSFSGSTHEVCANGKGESIATFALISGCANGNSIAFSKSYDGSGGWSHTVYYEGTLSSDATEIEGTWRVPGAMTGKFLMIRNTAKARALTREALEKV